MFKKGNLELSKNIIAEIDLEFLLESEKGVNLEHIRLSLVRYWLLTNDIDQAVYQAEFLKSTNKDFAIISISNYLKSLGEKVKSKQLLEQITFLPVKIRENLLLKYDDLDSLINRIDINELRTLISSQCQGNKDYYNYFFYTLAKSSVGKNNINAAFYFVREIKELGIKNECFQEMSLIMKNQSIANQSKRLFDFALDISNDEKKCLVNSIPMN